MIRMKDQVFTIRENGEPVWLAVCSGRVVAASWHDKGSAEAGLRTEQCRSAKAAGWWWRVIGRVCYYCKASGCSALHLCTPREEEKEEP